MIYDLQALNKYASEYKYEELPVKFTEGNDPYTRVSLYRDDNLEVVCICLAKGQTSSIHDHQGSNCVIRLVQGDLLEFLFDEKDGKYYLTSNHYLKAGDISGLDGQQIHQLANINHEGSVLLNFYSPPFKT